MPPQTPARSLAFVHYALNGINARDRIKLAASAWDMASAKEFFALPLAA